MNYNLLPESSGLLFLNSNPATNEIIIHAAASGKIELVEIYDVLGRFTPAPFPASSGTQGDGQSERIQRLRVDVSKLSPGIYFVKVRGEKGKRVGKFVKQ